MDGYNVYVLRSTGTGRTYVGQSHDIEARIHRHNSGYVASTRAYRPWKLVYIEHYKTRAEAMKREKWFKSGVGRRELQKMLQEEKR